MSKKHKQQNLTDNKSLKKAFFFLGIVSILIILSLGFRIFYIIKNSQYDGQNRFTVSVIASSSKAYIISLSPVNSSISLATVVGERRNMLPGKVIGVPINGTFEMKSKETLGKENPTDILFSLLFNGNVTKNNLTFIDISRMYLYAHTVSVSNTLKETINSNDNQLEIDKSAVRLFNDQLIVDEQKSIAIVNGTEKDGLGKRLERIIKNSGGNVISITNTFSREKHSKIFYYGESSFTQQKLEKVLGYPSETMKEREIADIKIIIGEDGERNDIF